MFTFLRRKKYFQVEVSNFQRAHHICDAKHLEDELWLAKDIRHKNKLPVPRQRGMFYIMWRELQRASIKNIFKCNKKYWDQSNVILLCSVYKLYIQTILRLWLILNWFQKKCQYSRIIIRLNRFFKIGNFVSILSELISWTAEPN